MASVIACGFCTEDYRHWLVPLLASLDQHGQAHDFVLAEKAGTMWETNTMAKASHILAAMDRRPNEVIVWLDVDCIVQGDLAPLADIRGDVAFRMHSKLRRHHKGARFRAQSGTMVFRPTPEARQFVEHWKRASERAPYGEIDQSSQLVMLDDNSRHLSFLVRVHAVDQRQRYEGGASRA
jgi:Nucleotide-diphospho-sugar transferase